MNTQVLPSSRDYHHALAHDQQPAYQVAGCAGSGPALQVCCRREGRREKRGIAAGNEPHQEGYRGDAHPELPGPKDVERDGLPREVLEERQTERDEDQRGHDGDAGDAEGFAHELADQLTPVRAEGLPKRDLAVTRERAGGRHVHEVETGQQDDDDGQGAEEQQVRAVAVLAGLVLELGVKVDVGQRLQPEVHRDVLGFPPGAKPFFEHIRHFPREVDGIYIR